MQYNIYTGGFPIQQIVGVTELQRKFRSFFDQVVKKPTSIVLTRRSRPEAVLIPVVNPSLHGIIEFRKCQLASPE